MQTRLQPPSGPRVWAFFPKSVRSAFKTSFLLTVINIVLASGMFFFLQPVIPIFYSLAQVEQQLQPKAWIFFYPFASLVIVITHSIATLKAKELDLSTQNIFSWATTGIVAFLTLLLIRTGLILL